MNAFTPGIIIALLIMFLLGILAGYSLVKSRVRKRTEELKVAQRRLAEIEQSHELRLRETTARLRQDYEAEIATTIEHYQDQLSQKTLEMEQVYKTRFQVFQEARPIQREMPSPSQRATAPQAIANSTAQSSTSADLQTLKQQYETRLKEATQKLQTVYEQQLAENLQTVKADIEADYEQQMATSHQELEQAYTQRQTELEAELTDLRTELETVKSAIPSAAELSTPSQIMGTGDETTVTLATSQSPEDMTSSDAFTQSQLDERIQAATQAAEADFERRLTEQLEAQQIEFDRRLQELESAHRQKLSDSAAVPAVSPSPVDELFGNSGEAAPTPMVSQSKLEDDLFADELFADAVNNHSSASQPPLVIEDDLFADELFADPPPVQPASDAADASELSDDDSEDDDGFEPLDLSDIV